MLNVTIDGQEYDLEQLSDEARQQLESLQFVDRRIGELQSELAVMQTARMAYANALKAALPATEDKGTDAH